MRFIDFLFPSLLSFLASSTLMNFWKVERESDHVRQDLLAMRIIWAEAFDNFEA